MFGTLFASLEWFVEVKAELEEDEKNLFISIPHSLWWAIITMTTGILAYKLVLTAVNLLRILVMNVMTAKSR